MSSPPAGDNREIMATRHLVLIAPNAATADYYMALAVAVTSESNCRVTLVLPRRAHSLWLAGRIERVTAIDVIVSNRWLIRLWPKLLFARATRTALACGIVVPRKISPLGRSYRGIPILVTLETMMPPDSLPEHLWASPTLGPLILNTDQQASFVSSKSGIETVSIGYPKAADAWKALMHNASCDSPETVEPFILIQARGPGKHRCKRQTEGYVDERLLARTLEAASRVVARLEGVQIVVCAHPKQDKKLLGRICQVNNIALSTLPSSLLASRAVAVLAMLSTAIIDGHVQQKPSAHFVMGESAFFNQMYPASRASKSHFGSTLLNTESELSDWLAANVSQHASSRSHNAFVSSSSRLIKLIDGLDESSKC